MHLFEQQILLQQNDTKGEIKEDGADHSANVMLGVWLCQLLHKYINSFSHLKVGVHSLVEAQSRDSSCLCTAMTLPGRVCHPLSTLRKGRATCSLVGMISCQNQTSLKTACLSLISWAPLPVKRHPTVCIVIGAWDTLSTCTIYQMFDGMALKPILVGTQTRRRGIGYILWGHRTALYTGNRMETAS